MRKRRLWKNRLLLALVCLVGGAAVLLGVVMVVYTLLQGLGNIELDMFYGSTSLLFVHFSLLPPLLNTLMVVVASGAISMCLGNVLAVLVSLMKKTGRARKICLFVLEAAAAIPPLVYGLAGQAIFCTLLGMGLSLWAGICTMSLMLIAEIAYTSALRQIGYRDKRHQQVLALGASRGYIITSISYREHTGLVINGFLEVAARICSEGVILVLTMGAGGQLAADVLQMGQQSGVTLTSMLYVYVSQRGNYTMGFAIAALLLMLVWLLLRLGQAVQNSHRGN